MLQTEYVRNLQSNYERIHLQDSPDERKYQYCIISRGGIKGLLACSIRYINGEVYLYYDITSRQNVAQLYGKQSIDRTWVKEFLWSLSRIQQEVGRFLLDEKNILLYPNQIFQDLGNHNFFFLYFPYHQEERGFTQLLEFLLERLDYDDSVLVECVYSMYEQYEKCGDSYLTERIYEDAKKLDENSEQPETYAEAVELPEESFDTDDLEEVEESLPDTRTKSNVSRDSNRKAPDKKNEKKSFLKLFSGKRERDLQQREIYRKSARESMEGYAVAEQDDFEEEYGTTIYVEVEKDDHGLHKLYTPDGRVAGVLDKEILNIGKQADEVDILLEDDSVSRLHARIHLSEQGVYLEDLNSRNGTYKNGIQLMPYEKRRLEEDDEIRVGAVLLIYR